MFEGKNILVTGSARNTGLGIAKVFGSYGATVCVHGRSAEKVEKVVQTLNHDASVAGEKYLPVVRFVPPQEFDELGEIARQMGFKKVASGPFVRSSYHARQMAESGDR